MRTSRFTTEQIVVVLQEWAAGGKPGELARRHGITETTLYRWKQKFGDLQLTEAKRLKAGWKVPSRTVAFLQRRLK